MSAFIALAGWAVAVTVAAGVATGWALFRLARAYGRVVEEALP